MKLSIITINLNNAPGLRKTIESVVSQTFSDFEYIVIDGGSTDGSINIIKEYSDKISYWVSEPDKGIYNAMNKGIEKAKGEYCLFLNSGDWLADDFVIANFYSKDYKEDIISGNLILWDNGEKTIREAIEKTDLGFEHFYNNRIPHPSTFIKRLLFSKFGFYNEELKLVSDWEFFLKCLIVNNSTYDIFNRIVSYYDLSGRSSLIENYSLLQSERQFVLKKYVPRFLNSYEEIIKRLKAFESLEEEYREYVNLKQGKLGFIVKYLLFLKEKKKHFYK